MKSIKWWQLVLVGALFLAVPVLSSAGEEGGTDEAGETAEEWVGRIAPEFSLKDLDGNPLDLTALRGKLVWLNFWGLRCGPCVRELPALQKIYQDYAARGLIIIAVNADGVDSDFIRKQIDSREELSRIGMTFPIAPDQDFAVIDGYGLMGAPLNVMIDPEGVIRYRQEGYEDGDEAHYLEVAEKLLPK